ncbi:TrkA-N domain-containing protein [Candidatus Nitrosopumilus koreensis AR1]|uniref:TrkA-N domain-containing protein n=1 Tax=Candidatus Nitrosopumilus koreensis AR1 TaxID=1229908 RepID=K0B5Z3_9ARCH|nr:MULTISPECIES: TrkA-N domain-containing protein [Nitrosopumilus]AFS80355.1 TrkA-N domain-containing protein [Candidatus Nitrosopumilus koreensis AR1]
MSKFTIEQKHVSENNKKHRIVSCFGCFSQMEVKEGVIGYGGDFFHPQCWKDFEKSSTVTSDLKTGQKKILIIGLGEIGYTNAQYMSEIGLWVDGYDINPETMQRALDENVIKEKAESFSGYDYYLICISTHKPENMFVPYLDGVYETAYRLLKEAKNGALLGIDSTVPQNTTRKILEILNHKLHVVHVPHRYYKHEKDEHGVQQERVIGACEQCCLDAGRKFYGHVLRIPLHIANTPDVAELTKIVENSYRYVQIAFSEEMKILCDNIGVDFDELRNSVNTKWNIDMLQAIDGIGGHCLPKDSQMVLDLSKQYVPNSIIESSKKVDSRYRMHIKNKTLLPTNSA